MEAIFFLSLPIMSKEEQEKDNHSLIEKSVSEIKRN